MEFPHYGCRLGWLWRFDSSITARREMLLAEAVLLAADRGQSWRQQLTPALRKSFDLRLARQPSQA